VKVLQTVQLGLNFMEKEKNGFYTKLLIVIVNILLAVLQIVTLLYVSEINSKIDKNYNEIKDNRLMIIDIIKTDK